MIAVENIFESNSDKSFWRICAVYQQNVRRELERIILDSTTEAEKIEGGGKLGALEQR
jgi:hypothetical protein